jgi:hypothetical protein
MNADREGGKCKVQNGNVKMAKATVDRDPHVRAIEVRIAHIKSSSYPRLSA